jgi:hypothetical protein
MKKRFLIGLLFLAACASRPNDFPPRPPVGMTVIVELPPVTAVPSLTPRPKEILNRDLSDAETFFLLLKTSTLAGDSSRVAEQIAYPLNVKVRGQMTTLHNAEEFLKDYDQVFNPTILQALATASETDLANLPSGIRVGNGELWFGLFCPDAACRKPVFLITKINN